MTKKKKKKKKERKKENVRNCPGGELSGLENVRRGIVWVGNCPAGAFSVPHIMLSSLNHRAEFNQSCYITSPNYKGLRDTLFYHAPLV